MFGDEYALLATPWKQRLDYVTKTLLYLRSDGAEVRIFNLAAKPPRSFPGLADANARKGWRRVEQLYDRYIVGPTSLDGFNATGHGEGLTPGQELPPHWRRGHFRLQPHGPQSSLRKAIFVAPVIVRADKLLPVSGRWPNNAV